jgi:DNA-binding response OmpR family regulator
MIEDEKYIAKAVEEVLKKSHYLVDLVYDGETGLDFVTAEIYDAIILDIMLPKRDGLSILKEVRSLGIETPILLLTARGETEDKVNGLNLGADDYLAKPFHTEELIARLKAICRRKSNMDYGGAISFANIRILPQQLKLECDECEIKLTLKEMQMIELLMNNVGRTVSKGTFIEKIWGYDSEVEDNHVEVHMSSLRKKIATINTNVRISTIRGMGYTLTDE